jgi:hypothetical protein
VEQGLEAFVLGEPCTDLRQEGLGDVEGVGFTAFLEGEVLSGVSRSAVMAAAARSSAAMGVLAEGGGQERRGRGKFLEPCLEHAEQVGGVVGQVHGTSGEGVAQYRRRMA